jgi:uncharacterized protein YbcV (DUF1398 family)
MKTTTKNIRHALKNMNSTPLNIKYVLQNFKTTLDKGMAMIALVHSRRSTAHINP